MKLYRTTYLNDTVKHAEFATSAGGASKIRTRLKKLAKDEPISGVKTEEVDVPTTRADLVMFLNGQMAHSSWRD